MSILLALGGSAAAVASFVLLMSNLMGTCSGVLSLLYTLAFVPCCVAGAFGIKGLLPKK